METSVKKQEKSALKWFASPGAVKALMLLSLLGAWMFGVLSNGQHVHEKLKTLYPESGIEKLSSDPLIYKITDNNNAVQGYIAVSRQQGWGGPLHVATGIDPAGAIRNIHVLHHRETPSFYTKLSSNLFFQQFIGKEINAPLTVGQDVDVITRATVSSKGFTRAIREGSHETAINIFNLPVEEQKSVWKLGSSELVLLLLFALIAAGHMLNQKKLRYVSMAAGLIFLGFYLNLSMSISHISSIILGYVPIPQEYLLWWLLVIGIFLLIIVFGKNLYCSWLCPFGALQEFLGHISGMSMKIHPMLLKYGKNIALFLTWLSMMIIFISRNPALGNYEPFAAIFSFEGLGAVWFILPITLLSSFFIRRFWCRFFCPVGVVLNTGCRIRNNIFKRGGSV